MKQWMHKIEVFVDKLIAPALLVLIVVIALELFFNDFVEHNHLELWIDIIDYTIIGIFIVDLIFKYKQSRSVPQFFKTSWLDIIAVFPFFLLFRIVNAVAGLFTATVTETTAIAQSILHGGVEIEKEASKIVQESEKIAKYSRTQRFARFMRPIARLPRFLKALPFYEKPTGTHYPHEKKVKNQESKKKIKNQKSKKKIIIS